MDQREILRQEIVADDGADLAPCFAASSARRFFQIGRPMSLAGVLMRSRAKVTPDDMLQLLAIDALWQVSLMAWLSDLR